MPANERPLSDVFRDIVRNIQEIVRSEIRLAKTEIREEAVKAKAAGLFIVVGSLVAVFSVFFLLLMIVYALSRVIPNWAAALLVGIALAIAAGAMLSPGFKRFKQLHPSERTMESIKGNVEWIKQQSK